MKTTDQNGADTGDPGSCSLERGERPGLCPSSQDGVSWDLPLLPLEAPASCNLIVVSVNHEHPEVQEVPLALWWT